MWLLCHREATYSIVEGCAFDADIEKRLFAALQYDGASSGVCFACKPFLQQSHICNMPV